jgi:DnaJ-class molecular chaperone
MMGKSMEMDEAYQTLVDIEKRKIYDSKLLGTPPLPENSESNGKDASASTAGDRQPFGMSNIGEVFGKAIQRFSTHKPATNSTLNPDIVETAQIIAK